MRGDDGIMQRLRILDSRDEPTIWCRGERVHTHDYCHPHHIGAAGAGIDDARYGHTLLGGRQDGDLRKVAAANETDACPATRPRDIDDIGAVRPGPTKECQRP